LKAKPVTRLRPQLASRGTWEDKVGSPLWVGEEKFDGTRYLAAFTRTGVRIVSRRGIEKTDRLPKLVAVLERWMAADDISVGTVLDGEIVAGSFSETISLVNSLGSRGIDSRARYRYMVFDILRDGREWCVDEKYRIRRLRLDRMFELLGRPEGEGRGIVHLTPQFDSEEFSDALARIWEFGGEGMIIKNLEGVYQQDKRSRSWIKVKAIETAEGVITGFTPGEGKYENTIGAIRIGQYRDGKFVKQITKISGMTDDLRYELGSNQEKYIGRVVEFAYQNKTDESYRHPRFKLFREDKRSRDCTWEDS
jgi:bifunctional non-homologous end joining protein LigD